MEGFWANHHWRARAAALLGALLVVWLAQWLAPQFLARAEEQVADIGWRATTSTRAERRLVVVDIDEASLSEVGAWP